MTEIINYKDIQLRQKEQELKYRKEKHVGLITDALFPFTNIKYSYEKGFYRKDNNVGFGVEDIKDNGGSEVSEKCRVC